MVMHVQQVKLVYVLQHRIPGATNLVKGIANGQMNSIPLMVITGQVSRMFISSTLNIIKHSYVIQDVRKITHIVREAFYIARNDGPRPVLIDLPKDVGLEKFKNYEPKNRNPISLNLQNSDFFREVK
jgi:acetolactate synthase-1/2/3 large subunit